MSVVPNPSTKREVSDTIRQLCSVGTDDAPASDDSGRPRARMRCTPDCVPEVAIGAPPGVAARLNEVPEELTT